MANIYVLDSGPLGLACGNPGKLEVEVFRQWLIQAEANSVVLVIPEIADFEVRRELIRMKLNASLKRLDSLCLEHKYIPINTKAMKLAAHLWADVRARGLTTAASSALDGDVIVAAQAIGYSGLRDKLTVITENVEHLSRFDIDARRWQSITL